MFRFHLARILGRTLAELDEMDAEEYLGWQVYLRAYPCLPVEDVQFGRLYQIQASKEIPPDKLFFCEPHRRKNTLEEARAWFRAVAVPAPPDE